MSESIRYGFYWEYPLTTRWNMRVTLRTVTMNIVDDLDNFLWCQQFLIAKSHSWACRIWISVRSNFVSWMFEIFWEVRKWGILGKPPKSKTHSHEKIEVGASFCAVICVIESADFTQRKIHFYNYIHYIRLNSAEKCGLNCGNSLYGFYFVLNERRNRFASVISEWSSALLGR